MPSGEWLKLTLGGTDSLKRSSFCGFENWASLASQKSHAIVSLFENVFRSILQDKSSTFFVRLEAKFFRDEANLDIRLVSVRC
jgi:hypothetical protein